MDNEKLKDFYLEVILKVLKKIDDEINRYKNLEDYEGVKTLETDVLPKYEKLYDAFSGRAGENIEDDKLDMMKSYIYDIMAKNNLSEEFILEEVKLRKSLKGNSGAEAVENLYRYEIKELEEKKNNLLKQANDILDRETELEMELSEAIQEVEQMEILEELPKIRGEYRKISERILKLQEMIDTVEKKVEKEWPFEVFGTISKEELLEAYKEFMK